MAQVNNWRIANMVRDTATGGVKTVYWECLVKDDTHTDCSASEAGKLYLTPDADADGFIAYEDLTEATVLGWVYDDLREGDETADEAKARIEADRGAKVTAQIAAKTAEADGTPW